MAMALPFPQWGRPEQAPSDKDLARKPTRQGTKPTGPGPQLGDFGCLRLAPAAALADTIMGTPEVGAKRATADARERFRWLVGISTTDHAHLGASWLMWLDGTRLLGLGSDGNYVRIRSEPYDWDATPPPPPPPVHTGEGAMAGANKRAQSVLSKAQEAQVQQIVDARLRAAGLTA